MKEMVFLIRQLSILFTVASGIEFINDYIKLVSIYLMIIKIIFFVPFVSTIRSFFSTEY